MTPDQHIAAIQSAILEVEQAQAIARKANKRAREATAILHARLADAAVAYRDMHGNDTPVMAAAVAPKERPE